MGMKRNVAGMTLAAVMAMVMTGCATGAGTSSAPTPLTSTSETAADLSPSPTPTVEPATPTPAVASLDGVGCDELVPIAILHANFAEGAEPSDPWRSAAQALPDEPARLAAEQASAPLACSWAFPGGSDGGVEVYGMTLEAAEREALIAELRDDAVFSESDVEGATTFARVEDGQVSSRTIGYLFDGPVWIAFAGNSPVESFERDYVPAMLASIRSAAER